MVTPAAKPIETPEAVLPPQPADPARPELIQSVRLFNDISTDPGVIATNAALALLTLILLLVTAEIFNQTLEENDETIRTLMGRLTAPVAAIFSGIGRVNSVMTGGLLPGFVGPLAMFLLAAGIYSAEEPNFGLNDRSLVLLFSFMGAFALQVYVYEGGQKLISDRNGWPSAIRVFPAGVMVAILCVLATRIPNLNPGLVYGFVAANAFTAPVAMTREQAGKQVFYPGLALIAIAVIAWLLADPLRSLAEDNDSWIAAVPEGIAIGLFASGLQSIFFQMIPIRFMDGHKILQWNKFAWFGMAVLTGFAFWHVLLNGSEAYPDALSETNTLGAAILLAICVVLTIATWLFFRWHNSNSTAA